MKSNLRKHEIIGLILIILGYSSLGYGLYVLMWAVSKAAFICKDANCLLQGKELLIIPLFFGLAGLFIALGKIEVKEAVPGKYRK